MNIHDEQEARENHAAMLEKFSGQPDAPLTGKYAKLRDDLKAALSVGLSAAQRYEDTGTCNFDAPALKLPRWNSNKIEQAAREAGTRCFDWELWGTRRWVFGTPSVGQARRNEEAAEAMTAFLAARGYDAFCYQAMD